MKKFIILFLFYGLIYCDELASQWINQHPTNSFNIFSCSFPSAQTGYVCGYGNLIKKTTNGGLNWTDISRPGTADNLNSVWFLNDLTGYIASTESYILRTTDGGNSWSEHFPIFGQGQKLFFINSQTGWCSSSRLYKTINAGVNWELVSNEPADDIYFLNEVTGYRTKVTGSGNSQIDRTTNGGVSWSTIHTTSDFKIMYDVQFLNENTGYVCGYRGYVAKTTDAGANWVMQRNIQEDAYFCMRFINVNTGWCAGENGKTIVTTNGGTNWNYVAGIPFGRLLEIEFINQNTGWIVGGFGIIVKTENAGGLTNISSTTGTVSEYSLYQNFPNPFNPQTEIRFSIPLDANVNLKIFNSLGEEVSNPVKSFLNSGTHSVTFNAGNLPSGIYFYKLSTANYSEVKKMMLLK